MNKTIQKIKRWFAFWCLKQYLKFRGIEFPNQDFSQLDISFTVRGGQVAAPVNYVEVTPASASKPVTETEQLIEMTRRVGGLISLADMQVVRDKCTDLSHTYKVIQLMAITYQTDDDILRDYDSYIAQLGHKLKKW